ncbi:MAG: TrkH family potassium uptake protein [Bacteroidales bacterium]|nr:TrkH family potassium uptake protein [Bacteroidales bacterium]
MNLRAISKNIGLALLVDAGFMFLSVIVAMLYHFDSSFTPLLIGATLTLLVGVLPIIFVGKGQNRITTREGFFILFFAWLLSCVFGLLPYALWGGPFSLENAWFESVSGFTATGATILSDIESLPHGLLFWRSSTHFIGGLGVVVFMMMILPSTGTVKLKMRRIEVSDMSAGDYNFRSNKIVRVVLTVYISMMVVCALLFMAAGLSVFDAVTHAFSVVATGGFSPKNASIGTYGSHWVELIAMVFMLASSLHYGLLYSSITGCNLNVLRNPISRFFFSTIGIGIVLMTASLLLTRTITNPFEAVWQSAFNVVSIGTSTGLATVDTSIWPAFCILLLLYFSIQCGCSGSTTGGLKADRIWVLTRAVRAQVVRTIHPNAVIRVKSGSNVIDSEQVNSIAMYALLYVAILFIGAVIYAACGMTLVDAFTGSCAMVGNVGPAFGSIGSMSNYGAVPILAKVIMGLEMIIGRLGLYAAFAMFALKKA